MDVIIYLLGCAVLIYLFLTLLPYLLWLAVILIVAIGIIILYVKHKFKKNMKQMQQYMEEQEDSFFTYDGRQEANRTDEDIIDVEFTQRDIDE